MNTPMMHPPTFDPPPPPEALAPVVIEVDVDIDVELNSRGGRLDIVETLNKVEEALEETFPASDPPCFTQAGVSTGPPPRR